MNIRFHLHFWKSQILKFAVLPCLCGYKCEQLALWLEGFFWWVHGFFLFSWNCFLTGVPSPFLSIAPRWILVPHLCGWPGSLISG